MSSRLRVPLLIPSQPLLLSNKIVGTLYVTALIGGAGCLDGQPGANLSLGVYLVIQGTGETLSSSTWKLQASTSATGGSVIRCSDWSTSGLAFIQCG